jgi:hypothetical protein
MAQSPDAIRNPLKSLDNDNNANNAIIFETLKADTSFNFGKNVKNNKPDSSTKKKPDPWDVEEVDP